ncbi:hypothetical protein V5T82_15030 [Magnetovibrio sp. PR-2]|uniref:hypothetical protein n=1 Tax=Magnetovibrio sp. PR-2 TaxID=3120356 RepID=UPI002FCE3D8C
MSGKSFLKLIALGLAGGGLVACQTVAPVQIDLERVELMPHSVAKKILVDARKDPLWRERVSKDQNRPSGACYFFEEGVMGILHDEGKGNFINNDKRPYSELSAVIGQFEEIMITDLRYGQQMPCRVSVWNPKNPDSKRLVEEMVSAMKSLGVRINQKSTYCGSYVKFHSTGNYFIVNECSD